MWTKDLPHTPILISLILPSNPTSIKMPTIIAPEPFITLLTLFIREGKHPGEFILYSISGKPLTQLVSRADDWNAENLWHIGAIIREYVPEALGQDISFERHVDIMLDGQSNFDSLDEKEKAWYNFCKEWDIPDYVERISESPTRRRFKSDFDLRRPESLKRSSSRKL